MDLGSTSCRRCKLNCRGRQCSRALSLDFAARHALPLQEPRYFQLHDAVITPQSQSMTKFDLRGEDCVTGMSRLTNESVDLVVTSPPYNLGIDYRQVCRPAGSAIVSGLVRQMVGYKFEEFYDRTDLFSERRLRAIESDVAPSNRDRADAPLQADFFAEYDSLDQVDRIETATEKTKPSDPHPNPLPGQESRTRTAN